MAVLLTRVADSDSSRTRVAIFQTRDLTWLEKKMTRDLTWLEKKMTRDLTWLEKRLVVWNNFLKNLKPLGSEQFIPLTKTSIVFFMRVSALRVFVCTCMLLAYTRDCELSGALDTCILYLRAILPKSPQTNCRRLRTNSNHAKFNTRE